MTDNDRMRRIERAQMRILFHLPFFAPGVAKLPVEFNDTTKTAETDGRMIWFGRAFMDSLKDQEIVTVLCHEVEHCLLGHLWRAPAGANFDTWNEAIDHVVNLGLKEWGAQIAARGLADPFPFPDGAFCCNPAYSSMSEEAIYYLLSNNKTQSGSGAGNGVQGVGTGKQSSKGTKAAGQGTGAQGSSNKSGRQPFGEVVKTAKGQAEPVKTGWEATLMQSIEAAKGRGTLPGSLQKYVEQLLNPVVPWQEVLRNFLREQASDDWNFMRPNRYHSGEFILPSLHSERVSSVVFGTDWSGSTQGELVEKFHAEKQECLDTLRPHRLIDIGFDTRVVKETEYAIGDTINPLIGGGGGTSFVEFFKRCDELRPKVVVVLTDLDGSFPSVAPEYPVIWCVWGGLSKAPFGEVINVR